MDSSARKLFGREVKSHTAPPNARQARAISAAAAARSAWVCVAPAGTFPTAGIPSGRRPGAKRTETVNARGVTRGTI